MSETPRPPRRRAKAEPATVRAARVSGRYGIVGALLAALLTVVLTASFTGLYGLLHGSSDHLPAAASHAAAASTSGPPITIEDVNEGGWDYGSWVYPRPLILTAAQLAAFKPLPTGSVLVNQAWITLTVAGNYAAPVTINNISIIKHCQTPLTRGATLFYVPPGAGSFDTSPVYFDLDSNILLGQYLSKQTGQLYSNFFAKQVVSLRFQEPWTFAIFVNTASHYCQFTFQLTVATAKGPVTQTISDRGKPFLLTSDGETMSGPGHVPFSSYAAVYAPTYDMQGTPHLVRVNPATYHGQRNPAPFQ